MKDTHEGDSIEKTREDVQKKVKSLIRIGIFFSIFWMVGIGSLISLVLGLKARKIIMQADTRIDGMGGVYWCLIVGGLGLIISLLILIAIIIPMILQGIAK